MFPVIRYQNYQYFFKQDTDINNEHDTMTYCTGIYSIIINVCKKAIRYLQKFLYFNSKDPTHLKGDILVLAL